MKTVPFMDRGRRLPSEDLRESVGLRITDANDMGSIDRLYIGDSAPQTLLTAFAARKSETQAVARDVGGRAVPRVQRVSHERHLNMDWNSSHLAKKRLSTRWPLAAFFPRESAESG